MYVFEIWNKIWVMMAVMVMMGNLVLTSRSELFTPYIFKAFSLL